MKQRSNYVEYILQRTGEAESRWIESLMNRIAEINETKPTQVSRYVIKALFDLSYILMNN